MFEGPPRLVVLYDKKDSPPSRIRRYLNFELNQNFKILRNLKKKMNFCSVTQELWRRASRTSIFLKYRLMKMLLFESILILNYMLSCKLD